MKGGILKVQITFLSWYRERGLWWFRVAGIWGPGIRWKRLSQHPLTFSEREGDWKCFKIGNWHFRLLGWWC